MSRGILTPKRPSNFVSGGGLCSSPLRGAAVHQTCIEKGNQGHVCIKLCLFRRRWQRQQLFAGCVYFYGIPAWNRSVVSAGLSYFPITIGAPSVHIWVFPGNNNSQMTNWDYKLSTSGRRGLWLYLNLYQRLVIGSPSFIPFPCRSSAEIILMVTRWIFIYQSQSKKGTIQSKWILIFLTYCRTVKWGS